jgi:hypothetical protein
MDKKTRLRLGYEKPIAQQLHEELFQTTSEFKYYELGVTTGLYSIYNMLNTLVKKGYEQVPTKDLIDIIVKSLDGDSKEEINIKDMFKRMIIDDDEETRIGNIYENPELLGGFNVTSL